MRQKIRDGFEVIMVIVAVAALAIVLTKDFPV